jgi:hypothetical protein
MKSPMLNLDRSKCGQSTLVVEVLNVAERNCHNLDSAISALVFECILLPYLVMHSSPCLTVLRGYLFS